LSRIAHVSERFRSEIQRFMTEKKENWYRTGAAAKLLTTSPYKIRELFRAGLIPSELRNGYRYISARELDRLKREGLPPMPASADLDSEEGRDGSLESDSPPRPTRSRLAGELYGDPSRKLVASKEGVIRLQHSVEAKRLKEESRQMDRAAREDQARAREAQRAQVWRDGYIRQVVETVPAEVCSHVCGTVADLLDRVPSCSNVSAQVAGIIDVALRPLRERERQERAGDAHRQRITRAVQSISLPFATPDEIDEAREVALAALTEHVPLGATDRQLRTVLDGAIRPVLDRVDARRADEERRRQLASRRSDVEATVSFLAFSLPLEATRGERIQAEERVRAALEQLPIGACGAEMRAVRERQIAPIKAAIQERRDAERQAERARFEALLKRL
jgi:hypothetical protein